MAKNDAHFPLEIAQGYGGPSTFFSIDRILLGDFTDPGLTENDPPTHALYDMMDLVGRLIMLCNHSRSGVSRPEK